MALPSRQSRPPPERHRAGYSSPPHRRLTSSVSPASALFAQRSHLLAVMLEPSTRAAHRLPGQAGPVSPVRNRPPCPHEQAVFAHAPQAVGRFEAQHYAVFLNQFSIVFNSRNCFKFQNL
jgi:hypothetical protein